MKQQRMVLVLLLMLTALASCSPGHLGSNVIAFIRDGHLWTIDPNGANAFEIVAQDTTPVVGYAWSPNHQLLTFRALDQDFAKTDAARQLARQPVTGQVGDVASTVNTIGVDGGTPITIAFSSPDILYSNPIWNTTGTRLLYRQTGKTPPESPDTIRWWVSQNDQPGGIAIKTLPSSYSIPSLSYASTNQLAIGNSARGLFTTNLAGSNEHFLQHEPLAGRPLPASLERVLWQPAHQNARVLYALPVLSQQGNKQSALQVQLILHTMDGQNTTLTTCTCTQFAWSPDGNHILYSTGSTYTITNLTNTTSFDITGAAGSVPYWSPDSQFLLLDGKHTLLLVHIANKQQDILLSDGSSAATATGGVTEGLAATNALLQPVANSVWAADSRHFLFLTHERVFWQGHSLSSGKGLYTVSMDNAGRPQGAPVVVDTGNDSQPGWTYQDANTSFLY